MEGELQRKIPIVTAALIGLNLIVWVILEMIGDTQDALFMAEHGASYLPLILDGGEWWRVFTCMFLHFGSNHLCNNMLILGLMGMRLEYVLGSVRFGILYLFSGLCGNLLSASREIASEDFSVSAGASGAIFGVVGGLIAWAVFHKGRVEGLTVKGLLGMVALSLYYGFTASGVDNWGHIGGLLGGLFLGSVFSIDFRKRKQYTNRVDMQEDFSWDGGSDED